jgi:hypothetical protein
MACFVLPQTILNLPTAEDVHNSQVSLSDYIQRQPVRCQHKCVDESVVNDEFRSKFSIADSIWFISTPPEKHYSVMINHTDTLVLKDLSYLAEGGTYISKLNDSTTDECLQFLFKLAFSFKHVCICKPEGVCTLSSIKYVVATDFIRPIKKGMYNIPYYFKMVLDEINSTYGQIQLEHLRSHTLSLGKI